jgi:GR25 family glycosyltransferase involved in LPS biosynthesis
MKIFVLHYSKLTERKEHILSQFKKHNITDYEFIEAFDKDTLSMSEKSIFVENFKLSMASLILKHFWVYSQIAEKYDCALILEDDIILSDNFSNTLNSYITQLPEDYDMFFIGNGCNLHIQRNKLVQGKFVYDKCLEPTSWGGHGATRCTDSYIVSKKCAKQLLEYIKNLKNKIYYYSDHWLNVACIDNKFKIFWAEPTIVTQGTQVGKFKTSH